MNNLKKNTILMFADTVLFVNAMAFLSINAVIPYFLSTLGASTFQVSLASALVGIGTFISQPIFSKKAAVLPYKLKSFVKILSIQRLFFLGFILTIPFLAGANPKLMIVLFLICWGIFNFFTGSYSPFYMSLFSKMVPEQRRGRLLGFSGAVGNLLAMGSAFLTAVLLKNLAFPYNYTCIFGLGVLLLLLDNLDFALMHELPDETVEMNMGYFQYIREIPQVLKGNKRFSRLVLGYSFFVISNVSLAYYTLYAIRGFGASAGEIALFTAIAVSTNTLGNVFFGVLADKKGHHLVLQIAAACGMAAAIIIIGLHSILGIYLAFALSTLCSSGYQLSSSMLIIQNSPKEQLPVYIGINVMITLIVSSIVTLGGSFIIDSWSFLPLFSITGAAGLGAFLLFYFMNRENKSRIKPIRERIQL